MFIFYWPGGRHTPQCPPTEATPQTSQMRLLASQPPAPASTTQRSDRPPPHLLREQQVRWDTDYQGAPSNVTLMSISGQNSSDQPSIKRTPVADSSAIYPGKRANCLMTSLILC